jgi:hypothetical protein
LPAEESPQGTRKKITTPDACSAGVVVHNTPRNSAAIDLAPQSQPSS